MNSLPKNDKAPVQGRQVSKADSIALHRTAPQPTGQCLQVFNLIKNRPGILSLEITAGEAIPECAARVHDLRCMGFNILTSIHAAVAFRGQVRRNVAAYSLGVPEWPRPGFLDGANDAGQLGLDLGSEGGQ